MIQETLKNCTVEGNIVKLPAGQLERADYLEVKKKLELIGGKWKGGKTQGFVFEEDPTELLAAVANGDDRNLKKEYQFFATPKDIAEQMVSYLPPIKDSDKILEPSAGDGALIHALVKLRGVASVDCFETMDLNRMKLSKIPFANIIGYDFLRSGLQDTYDIIIANPPFTNNQDIDHIRWMFHTLKPGGTIITLSSPSWTFGSQKKQIEFKQWLEDLGVFPLTLPQKSFASSGTAIAPVLLHINKPTAQVSKLDELVRFSDEELTEFKTIVDEKLTTAIKECTYLEDKLKDESAESKDFPKDQVEQMIARQKVFIGNLNAALGRIENKTYGICATTGKLIDKDRLRAVPHARLSSEAKKGPAGPPPIEMPAPVLKAEESTHVEATQVSTTDEPQKQEAPQVRTCRICGCTEGNCSQCIAKTGQPCHWVGEDLCSACVEPTPSPTEILQSIRDNEKDIQQNISGLERLISPIHFFRALYPMIDGINIEMKIKRMNGKLIVAVLPQTASVIKPVELNGTAEELDEGFFNVITKPIEDAKGLKFDVETYNKSILESKKKNAETPKPADKKPVPAKTASSKPAVKKKDPPKPQEKKSAVKKETKKPEPKKKVEVKKPEPKIIKPAAPDMFAGL